MLHLSVIEVDINRGIDEVTGLVGQALGLPEAGHEDDHGST